MNVIELLTPAEIEDALGQPVTADVVATIDCRYTTAEPALAYSAPHGGAFGARNGTPDVTEVTVSVVRPMEGTAESFVRTIAAGVGPDGTTRRIDGLGDAAVLATTADLRVLNVKAGDAWLTVGMPRRDHCERGDATLLRLARIALLRLR